MSSSTTNYSVLGIHQGRTIGKDKVNQEMTEYYSLFDHNNTKGNDKRKEKYDILAKNFYDLVTDFYEYGWGESFHFAPRHNLESFPQSIARYELYIALRCGLKPGMKVLDVGCGVGGPQRTIARFSGANVTGLNINEYQIARAKIHTRRDHLDGLCDYLKGDFMNMPAEDNTYDAVYEVEATCHAPEKEPVYAEIFRVLKPGGLFAGYEWCMTEKYDENNKSHQDIKFGIELGNGLPPMVKKQEVIDALKSTGFEIIELTDFGFKTEQNPIPWYDTLNGRLTWTGFRYTRVGRWCTAGFVWLLETVRFAPKGSLETALMLNRTADQLVKGGATEIFTPSFFVLCRKPVDAVNPPKKSGESKKSQ
eukprot:TRINITY_DN3453_c0_g1_i1.p1 TRINITY_DN3453_c0_g1~~TRINITY_DN3453_c0_g1_i1.p1  ORF type:complete len:364 (+),score=171.88 TRINITY_DN3453_c0_g1_i1:64-1155(+)